MTKAPKKVISEVSDEQVEKQNWPSNVFDFEPIDDVRDFKKLREDLNDHVSEDPLA